MSHLKTGNSEASGIVCRCAHGHQVGAVRDVLVVELYRHLIVTCKQRDPLAMFPSLALYHNRSENLHTGFLSHVSDAAGSVFSVLKGDFCTAGAFHGDGQTSSTSLTCPDTELG